MKKILSISLILVLILGMAIPQAAFAAGGKTRTSSLQLEGSDSNEAEGWSWDADTNTLMLNNATIITDDLYAIQIPYGTIILEGNNTIKSTCNNPKSGGWGYPVTAGIQCYNGNLTIKGNGSLTAVGGVSKGGSYGIYASKGFITIDGGTISAQGGECGVYGSAGIKANYWLAINGGTVTAKGGSATGTYASSYGVNAYDLKIKGGILNASAGSVPTSRSEYLAGVSIARAGDIDLGSGVAITNPASWTVEKINGDYSAIIGSNGRAAKEVTIQGEGQGQVDTVEPNAGSPLKLISCTPSGGANYLENALIFKFNQDIELDLVGSYNQLNAIKIYEYDTNRLVRTYDLTNLADYHGSYNGNTYTLQYAFRGLDNGRYYITVDAGFFRSAVPNQDGTYNYSEKISDKSLNFVFYNLSLKDLTYQFGNSKNDFGYSSDYKIPLERYQLIFGDTELASNLYKNSSLWGGNCFGMTSTSALFFQANGIGVSSFNSKASVPYDLSTKNKNSSWNLSLQEFIEAMQVGWYASDIQNSFNKNKNNLNSLCSAVEKFSTTGVDPVLIVFMPKKGIGHVVIGYAIESVSKTQSNLMIYDPNYPDSERYITLTTNSAGQYTGWNYRLDNWNNWGSSSDSTISYIPYSAYYSVWANRTSKANANTSMVLTSLNTENASIYDSAGLKIASIQNGSIVTDKENVFPMFSAGIIADDNSTAETGIQVWLPSGLYTIVNEDPATTTFEASMVHVDQSASVSTSGNTVSFVIDDQSKVDYAGVSGRGETYSITLSSTLNSGYKSIQLDGTVSDNETSIAQISGKLYANGMTSGDETLRVDGKASSTDIISGKVPNIVPGLSSDIIFKDVPANAYYYDAVQWAVANGITAGTSATTFGPNVTCTRGQIVTFLWHAAGSPKPTSNRNPFTDVKAGSYYYDAVLWAVENNITSGTSVTTFSPDQGCTRGQVMTFLYHYEKNPQVNSTKNPFVDVKAQDYFYNAVLWAVENDITSGTSATTFDPNAMCTRAQIVTFLYRDLA